MICSVLKQWYKDDGAARGQHDKHNCGKGISITSRCTYLDNRNNKKHQIILEIMELK